MMDKKPNKRTVRRATPAALDVLCATTAQDFLKTNGALAVKLLPYQRGEKPCLRVCILHDGAVTAARRNEIATAAKTAFNTQATETIVMRKPQKFRHADARLYGYTDTIRTPLHTGLTVS